MVVSAFFAAMSIVLGKYLAINLGEVLRFSLENLPIIFVGLAFGSVAGGAVGALADLLGCVLVGYTINPLVTVGATAIGVVAGIYRYIPKKSGGVSRYILIFSFVFLSHAVGSVIIKTVGLASFYSMPLVALMLWRALNYLIVGAVEGAVLCFLFKSKAINTQINNIMPRRASRRDGVQ